MALFLYAFLTIVVEVPQILRYDCDTVELYYFTTKSKGEVIMELVRELKVTVRQFLTKSNPNYPSRKPVPMRTMFGYSTKETEKGIYMVLRGKPEPSTTCLHCNRKLTHPVSLLYGIGPHCGEHFHISPYETEEELNQNIEELKKTLADITWEGWLPKNHIEWEETDEFVEVIKTEEVVEERLYPELTIEQEKLVELARENGIKNRAKPKPTEIWIDSYGIVKLLFDNKDCFKINKVGDTPTKSGVPYAPKYNKIYDIEYPEIDSRNEVEIDNNLVKELADELISLYK